MCSYSGFTYTCSILLQLRKNALRVDRRGEDQRKEERNAKQKSPPYRRALHCDDRNVRNSGLYCLYTSTNSRTCIRLIGSAYCSLPKAPECPYVQGPYLGMLGPYSRPCRAPCRARLSHSSSVEIRGLNVHKLGIVLPRGHVAADGSTELAR